MRILVVSDLHGDFEPVDRARAEHRPDLILSCGDWGDPEQVSHQALKTYSSSCPFIRHSAITTHSRCWLD